MRKRLCAMIMALLLLCCLPMAASAETLVDLDKEGSITVKAVYKKVPLEGMKLNCIQVGELVPNDDVYYFKSLYHDAVYDSENIHDSEHPAKMLELVQDSASVGYTKSADKDGNIKFEKLKPGLYLIYQTESFEKAGNKYEIDEFFVSIPYDGKYHVNANCKPGLDLYPEEPTCPPGCPPGSSSGKTNKVTKLPQTGQLSWPVPVMAVTGMFFFALGWWLCFGGRKDPHEK